MKQRRKLSLVVALAMFAGVLAATTPASAAAFNRVIVGDLFFKPADITVKVGETVRWDWDGQAPHTVTAFDGSFDSGTKFDGTFSQTFTEAGVIGYFCQIHPDVMQGTVTVLGAGATEIPGGDAVSAAIGWSKFAFADGSAGTAILGRADVFADSLSSGGLQGALDAPLLLTPPNSLASSVRAELKRLGASRVIILGGTAAVSKGVEDQLRSMGFRVGRVSGANRFATAVAAANQHLAEATSAIVARGTADASDPTRAFVDSLAAGALAARTGQPVLLSATEGLSRETQAYIQNSRIEAVTLVGGEAALSPKVQADLERIGVAVDRVAGPDRFFTAAAVSEGIVFGGALNSEPFAHTALLVDGRHPMAWASGFAAASAAVQRDGFVLLTDGAEVPAPDWVPILQIKPGIVCGPFVDDAACAQANTGSNVDDAFELPATGSVVAGLTPEAETEDGPPGATGLALFSGTSDPRALCYEYFVPALPFVDGPATAAHIHRGAEGEDGPVVVPLSTENSFPGEVDVYDCVFGLDPALVDEILSDPASFYINVHTENFPAGATRGQLFTTSKSMLADMTGDQGPTPGQPGAGGFGFFVTSQEFPQRLCYFAVTFGLESAITAAHIHEGGPDEDGPPVVNLVPPMEVEPGFGFVIACVDGDAETLDRIEADPFGFYVNVHTEDHPPGAVRGQLVDIFGGDGDIDQAEAAAVFQSKGHGF